MLVATVKCANPVIPGLVTPYLNQSSEGVYRFKGGSTNNMQFYSYWYQDNAQKRLALGIGERNKDLQAHFWFLDNVAYELTPKDSTDQSKGYKCERFIGAFSRALSRCLAFCLACCLKSYLEVCLVHLIK